MHVTYKNLKGRANTADFFTLVRFKSLSPKRKGWLSAVSGMAEIHETPCQGYYFCFHLVMIFDYLILNKKVMEWVILSPIGVSTLFNKSVSQDYEKDIVEHWSVHLSVRASLRQLVNSFQQDISETL